MVRRQGRKNFSPTHGNWTLDKLLPFLKDGGLGVGGAAFGGPTHPQILQLPPFPRPFGPREGGKGGGACLAQGKGLNEKSDGPFVQSPNGNDGRLSENGSRPRGHSHPGNQRGMSLHPEIDMRRNFSPLHRGRSTRHSERILAQMRRVAQNFYETSDLGDPGPWMRS